MEQDPMYDVGYFDRSKIDLNKPATTVHEYMQQVVGQRELLPSVVVAPAEVLKKVQQAHSTATKVPGLEASSSASAPTCRFGPSREWCISRSNEFSHSRSLVEDQRAPRLLLKGVKLPAMNDSMRWCQVCFESRMEGLPIGQEELFAHHKGTPPTTGLLKSLNDAQVNELIMHQTDYMLENGYTLATLQWLYALLLVMKKPLIQEVCSALRQFCRKCKEWRAELDEDEEDVIYQLSWFVAIISIYFEQRDLAEYR